MATPNVVTHAEKADDLHHKPRRHPPILHTFPARSRQDEASEKAEGEIQVLVLIQ
jgi:hypothetical protein